jgi:ribosomal protein S27E
MSTGRVDSVHVTEGGFITEVAVHCLECNEQTKRLFYEPDVTIKCPKCGQKWILNVSYELHRVEAD